MTELSDLYLKEKPVKALLFIYQSNGATYCGEISEDIDSTYAHTVKIVSKFKELGVLNTEKQGRRKMLSLTESGEKQAKLLNDLMTMIGETRKPEGGKIQDNELFEYDEK